MPETGSPLESGADAGAPGGGATPTVARASDKPTYGTSGLLAVQSAPQLPTASPRSGASAPNYALAAGSGFGILPFHC